MDYIASYHQNSGKVLQILFTSLKDVVDIEKGGEVALQFGETYDVLAKVLWKSVKDKNIADMKRLIRSPTSEGRVGRLSFSLELAVKK